MMKVVRTVRSGGKDGDCIKILPITIVYGIAITAMSFFTDPTMQECRSLDALVCVLIRIL